MVGSDISKENVKIDAATRLGPLHIDITSPSGGGKRGGKENDTKQNGFRISNGEEVSSAVS